MGSDVYRKGGEGWFENKGQQSLLFCQMFLFGLGLVDLVRSPPIHLLLQLFLLPVQRVEHSERSSP